MPTFPTYRGELPACLRPLNPRHWLLLAYWIYFRPTALKCYLYQAAPEIYRKAESGLEGLERNWQIKAYRSLWLMMPVLNAVLSVLAALLLSWAQCGIPINWAGVAGGIALGVAGGVAFGVAGGVTFGVTGGVAFGVAFGVLFGVEGGLAGGILFGLAFGVLFGVAGVMVGVVVGTVALAMSFSVSLGVTSSVMFSVALSVGALRLPFYLMQLLPAWLSKKFDKHPAEWDELGVLPLPVTRAFLLQKLQENEAIGLFMLTEFARNPFQRWAVQSALFRYLHAHPQPLHVLYRLLADLNMDEFIFAPAEKQQWDTVSSMRKLMLAELNGRRSEDILVSWLTHNLRDRRVTPLTQFAGLLHDLLSQQKAIEDDKQRFTLGSYRIRVYVGVRDERLLLTYYENNVLHRTPLHVGVRDYPGGTDIARSFAAIESYMACGSLAELAAVGDTGDSQIDQASAILQNALATIAQLGSVRDDIRAYRDSTSRANKQAAILRATNALKNLDQYVQDTVGAPEQYLLRRIIRQWQALMIAEGGMVGKLTQRGPVANPYILNNPVEGERFVGRDDIMRRLEELWTYESQVPSVVIYGHRRMGKTSILHNLGRRFGAQTVIVDFNMQRVGRVANDADLLYQLALHIYDECVARGITGLAEPSVQDFPSAWVYLGFTRFLKRLDRLRNGRRLIITIDEFEKIEAQMEDGQLTPALLDFWRGTFTTFPWLVLAFAGLYSLEERRHDYWSPLFGSVTGIKVSFLTTGAARRLITEPSPDFDIDYDEAAIEQIIALTGGQPFLIQMIGHALVTRFNQLSYEESREQERRFHLGDVEQVINAPTFDRDGSAYFNGVWGQAEGSAPGGQLAVLRALAPHSDGLPLEEIVAAAGLAQEQAREALRKLSDHDVVVERDGRYVYTVELMRRWVLRQHP